METTQDLMNLDLHALGQQEKSNTSVSNPIQVTVHQEEDQESANDIIEAHAMTLSYEPTLDPSLAIPPPMQQNEDKDELAHIFETEAENIIVNKETIEESSTKEAHEEPDIKTSHDDDEEALIAELEGEQNCEADDDEDEEQLEEDEKEDEAETYHAQWRLEKEDEELKALMRRFCPELEDGDEELDEEEDDADEGNEDTYAKSQLCPDGDGVAKSRTVAHEKTVHNVWDIYGSDNKDTNEDEDNEDQENDEPIKDEDEDDDEGSDKENATIESNGKYQHSNLKKAKSIKTTAKSATPSFSVFGSSSISLSSSLLSIMDDEDEAEMTNLVKRIHKTNTVV